MQQCFVLVDAQQQLTREMSYVLSIRNHRRRLGGTPSPHTLACSSPSTSEKAIFPGQPGCSTQIEKLLRRSWALREQNFGRCCKLSCLMLPLPFWLCCLACHSHLSSCVVVPFPACPTFFDMVACLAWDAFLVFVTILASAAFFAVFAALACCLSCPLLSFLAHVIGLGGLFALLCLSAFWHVLPAFLPLLFPASRLPIRCLCYLLVALAIVAIVACLSSSLLRRVLGGKRWSNPCS